MDDGLTDEQRDAMAERDRRAWGGLELLDAFMPAFMALKPNDRSGLDRVYAVTITELEKAYCYFTVMAFSAGEDGHLDFIVRVEENEREGAQ